MDLRQMRQFVAVAEELHFGRAARRLNMAQPPLSQAIGRLELDLGVKLLDRSKRVVELTEAGRVFLSEARRTLLQAEHARNAARQAACDTPEVRVAFTSSALYRVLPAVLRRHRAACADVKVQLLERSTDDQVEGILKGDLDLGFVSDFARRTAGLASLVVERSEACAAVPADWRLARQDAVSVAELAAQPFILPPLQYAAYYAQTLQMFEAASVTPRIVQEAAQVDTIISLVGAGLGCSVVGSGVALTQPRNVSFLQISDAPPYRPSELLMIWSADGASKTSLEFVETTQDHLADHPELLNPRQ